MATDKRTLAMRRLLKKLSALRKTLRKDERELLDQLVIREKPEVMGHSEMFADQGADFGADQGADFGADQGADSGADQGADFGADQGADWDITFNADGYQI